MPDLKKKYSATVKQVLEEAYVGLRETGELPVAIENYLKGFLDAGLHMGGITNVKLQAVIDESNFRMFGVSRAQRKHLFQNLRNS